MIVTPATIAAWSRATVKPPPFSSAPIVAVSPPPGTPVDGDQFCGEDQFPLFGEGALPVQV